MYLRASEDSSQDAAGDTAAEPWNFGDWLWETLQGLATVAPLGTFAAALIAGFAIWQKSRSDRRQAWWDRLKWASDTALSKDDETSLFGIEAVKAVSKSRRVHRDDQPLLEAIGKEFQVDHVADLPVLGDSEVDLDAPGLAPDNGTDQRGLDHA